MITRRELVQIASLVSLAAPLLARPSPALAGGWAQGGADRAAFHVADALVLDQRHPADPGADFDRPPLDRPPLDRPPFDGPEIWRIDGDVTGLYYHRLDRIWRQPGFVLAGITGADALFVLGTLAGGYGRRVVSRRDLGERGQGGGGAPVAWIIAPVHPSVQG